MIFNPAIHHRRSIRLMDYDYSKAGAYFVTICTQNKECLFGSVIDGKMRSNDSGNMIQGWWTKMPDKFPTTEIDEHIVMPNHFHGIIFIVGAPLVGARISANDRAGTRPAPTLGDVIGVFKSITTHSYTEGVIEKQWQRFPGKLWQRNYYERIIPNETELNKIREYIINNPLNWETDENYSRS